MKLQFDYILESQRLKKQIIKWRFLAFSLLVIIPILLKLAYTDNRSKTNLLDNESYIGRIYIDGMIFEDRERIKVLEEIANNKNVKALIMHIDSPGGTFIGSESTYYALRKIAEKKPLVATLGSIAASGGYMIALSADYILAYNGTITGSIGVLFQSFEVTELANKLGIELYSFKSSPVKASPNPFEKITPEVTKVTQDLINDMQSTFVSLVQARRSNIGREQLITICDGSSITGRQALEKGLIDEIGGEDKALEWLASKKNIKDLKVIDINLSDNRKHKNWFGISSETLSSVITHSIITLLNSSKQILLF